MNPTRSSMNKSTVRTSTGRSGMQDTTAKIVASGSTTDGASKPEKVTVRQKLDEVTKPLRVKLFGRGTSKTSITTSTTTTPTSTITRTTTAVTRTLTSTKTVTTSIKSSATPGKTVTTTTTRVTVFPSKDGSPKVRESISRSTSGYSSRDSSSRFTPTTSVVSRSIIKKDEIAKSPKAAFFETPEKKSISKTPLTEKLDRNIMPRTPSEEVLQDSCYHTNISLSKSSSAASMTMDSDDFLLRRTPSRERMDLDSLSVGSETSSSKGSEWYQEYKSQSFQNYNSKLERVLTRQEYDSHIAEIRGEFFKKKFFFIQLFIFSLRKL